MFQINPTKTVKLLAIFLLVTLFWLLSFTLYGQLFKPPVAIAQEPDLPVSPETLAAFAPWLPSIQVADNSQFDLTISKSANLTSVNAGGPVMFTITITNNGPDQVTYIFFYDDYPVQMKNVAYLFSTTAISDGLAKPTWLLPDPIPNHGRVTITVTGILTSAPDITVTNTAIVTPYVRTGETNPTNNSAQAQVGIEGYSTFMYIYLPILFKAPPPPPITEIYHEDFSSSDAWYEFNSNGCRTENRDGRYWVEVDSSDRDCLPPAKNDSNPEKPYRTYGEFEVAGYHSEDINNSGRSNAAYGIFINGQGGDNFYLLRIWPNNGCSSGGDWQFIRNRSGSWTTLRSGTCNLAINRGGAINILRIGHKSDGTLTMYVNGTLLGTVSDNTITGESTGVYVRSANRDVRIKFDDFRVYRYN